MFTDDVRVFFGRFLELSYPFHTHGLLSCYILNDTCIMIFHREVTSRFLDVSMTDIKTDLNIEIET